MLGGTDPTLAGRVPPVISAFQLRPSPTGAALIPNIRRYSDNQVPYISIFQNFILPIKYLQVSAVIGTNIQQFLSCTVGCWC